MIDFVRFLKKNNIHYEKRKDGMPNMKYSSNKSNYKCFIDDMNTKNANFKNAQRRIDFSSVLMSQQMMSQHKAYKQKSIHLIVLFVWNPLVIIYVC